MEPLSGNEALLDRYALDREVAHTAAGVLYDASDKVTKRPVSIELANDLDDDARLVFERDAMLAQHLEGVHVLRVLDVGALADGTPFVVREPTLASLAEDVSTRGPLPTSEAVAWALEVCEALAEAHAQGIAHGDIRPENVFLTRNEAGNLIAKVRWTSIAKAARAAREDVARDIAGTATLLLYLITGRGEVDDEGAKTLPNDLGHSVARATSKNPDARFRNVGELASAIARYAPSDHASSRNITAILSRAGIVGTPVATPSERPSPVPAFPAAPTSRRVPVGTRHSEPGLNEEWFASQRPSRTSDLPYAPPMHRSGAFIAVALLVLGATLLGTLYLSDTHRLPQWTGTAPEADEAKMERVSHTELTNALVDTTLQTPPRVLQTDQAERENRAVEDPTNGAAPIEAKPRQPRASSKATSAESAPSDIEPAEPWPGTTTPATTPMPPPADDKFDTPGF
jgi:serine/threonine-protein kinase